MNVANVKALFVKALQVFQGTSGAGGRGNLAFVLSFRFLSAHPPQR